MVRDTKAEDFCRTVSNFSLEYRTTRQAILLQRERERQKSGAESPGPNTPAARRKHQQTPTEVFFLFQMLIKSILDRMIDLICQPAICWSSRKTRSSSGLRRCWGHLSPHRDWTALCLETAGGWRISKVLNVIHTCLNKTSTCLLSFLIYQILYTEATFVYFTGPVTRKLTWWPCWCTFKSQYSHWRVRTK